VINAMIEAKNGGAQPPANAAALRAELAPGTLNPEEVILTDGSQDTPMRYIAPQMRTALKGLSFLVGGRIVGVMVLTGARAKERVASRVPTFLLAMPNNAQPESYFTLASFATRNNNTREVLLAGGATSYTPGVRRDRVMPTSAERLPDQSKAPNGYTIYGISVTKPLVPGEYALILYSTQVRCFDFGIDA